MVAALVPDMAKLAALPGRGVVVSVPGREYDFVSRWFGPKVGVEEDPVTSSAHTTLAPYWAGRLGKTKMTARQGGSRQGQLTCECLGDRVILTGQVAPYLRGTIWLLRKAPHDDTASHPRPETPGDAAAIEAVTVAAFAASA